MTLLLSLCVLTYNRSALLAESLEGIFSQITPEDASALEVLIADNASPDDTPAVVARFEADYPQVPVRSIRRSENIGPDRNFYESLRVAQGRFVYFLSDDDVLLPGAVAALLDVIRSHPDLDGLCPNVRLFTENPAEEKQRSWTLPEDTILQGRDAALLFLKTHITFMSSVVFRRDAVADNDYSGRLNSLPQSYFFLDALAPGQGVYVTSRPFLAQRADNNQGYNFFAVFVTEFAALMRYAVEAGYSPAAVQTVLRRHLIYLYHILLVFKYRGAFGTIKANYRDAFRRLWRVYGLNGFVFFVLVPIMLTPAAVFPPLQRLYQRIKTHRAKSRR